MTILVNGAVGATGNGCLLLAEIQGETWVLAFPVLFGLVYALGAILIKRGMKEGIGPWRTTFVSNLAMGGMASLLLFLGGGEWQGWWKLYQPLLAATTFLFGQIFTFLALSRGDVSVATPLMGTKILFVAIFSVIILSIPIGWALWCAAILAALAVFLLGAQVPNDPRKIGVTILFSLCSAACFGFTDVLLQNWASDWGFALFVPLMFIGFALFSFGFIPFFRGGFSTVPRKVWSWLIPGALVLAAQSIGLAVVLGIIGRATEVNILYSTRGLWSVALVWFVGSWFGNYEGQLGQGVLIRRLAGAGLLLAAVVLVTLG